MVRIKKTMSAAVGILLIAGTYAAVATVEAGSQAPLEMNLLQDAGFDRGALGRQPAGWHLSHPERQSLVVVDGEGRDGGRCLKLDNAAQRMKGGIAMTEAVLGEEIFLPYHNETAQYLVEASVRVETPAPGRRAGPGALVGVRYGEPTTKVADKFNPAGLIDPARSGWQDIQYVTRYRWRWAKLGVGIWWQHPGAVYIDEVRITRLRDLATAHALKRLEPRYRDASRQTALTFRRDRRPLPSALGPHIGKWRVTDGALRPEGPLPPGGYVVRAADTYLPERLVFDFEFQRADQVLFVLLGDWKISIYSDHIGLRYLYQPLVLFPQTADMDAAAGEPHRLHINLQPNAIAVQCDGTQVLDYSAADFRQQADADPLMLPDALRKDDAHQDPMFANPFSRICFQSHLGKVTLDNIRINGVRTGKATGFARLRWPQTAVSIREDRSPHGFAPWPHETADTRTRTIDAQAPVSEQEKIAPRAYFRYEAPQFDVRVSNVPPGTYELRLSFYEDQVRLNGERVFDVGVNGKLVWDDLDILRETNANFIELQAVCPVSVAADGRLRISLASSTRWAAILNEVTLLQAGREVLHRLCGFTEKGMPRKFVPPYVTPKNLRYRGNRLRSLQLRPPEDYSVNIVANPGFEETVKTNLPAGWEGPQLRNYWGRGQYAAWLATPLVSMRSDSRTIPNKGRSYLFKGIASGNLWQQGKGDVTLDRNVRHGGAASLRLGKTRGTVGLRTKRWFKIDFTRPYEVLAWVKGHNLSGTSRLRADFRRKVNKGQVLYCGSLSHELPAGTYDWQPARLRIEPPYGAQEICFSVTSTNNAGTLWVDDLHCDGYGEIPVEVKVSQGGYEHQGTKEAVVWANDVKLDDAFRVVDSETGRTLHAGPLRSLGQSPLHGREVFKADFSAFDRTGRFVIEIRKQNGDSVRSRSFPVENGLYKRLVKLTIQEYFRIIAANVEVPEWHGADFLDDGRILNLRDHTGGRARLVERHLLPRRYVPLIGSYYDAGDFSRKPMACLAAYGCGEAMELWAEGDNQFGERLPDPLHLGWWQTRLHVDSQLANGHYLHGVGSLGSRGYRFADPASLSDGIPGTGDEKGIVDHPNKMLAFAVAHFAWAVRDSDPELSRRYAASALRNWRNMVASWDASGGHSAEPWQRLFMDGSILWSALYLEQLFPKDR